MEFLLKLDFNCNAITDDSLKEFRYLMHLEYLDISVSAITDNGLQDLAKLKWLKYLDLYETKITEEGAAWLKSVLVDVEIEHCFFLLDYESGLSDDESDADSDHFLPDDLDDWSDNELYIGFDDEVVIF